MRLLVLRVMTFVMVLGLIVPFTSTALAQRTSRNAAEPASSAALVSGTYRVEVRQTVVDVDPAAIGPEATDSDILVVAITDVTNLGAAATIEPGSFSIGGAVRGPLEMTDGIVADTEASQAATSDLALSPDATLAVGENNTIRIALVFKMPSALDEPLLILRVGDQVMDISNTIAEQFEITAVPAVVPVMDLRIADITNVDGDGNVTVAFRDGGAESIALSAILTPEAGSANLPGCYFNESAAAISAMSGGTVWLEADGETGDYLAWVNNAAMGTFDLMNARLVQEGFAGSDVDAVDSPYFSWMDAAEEFTRGQGTGLWATCKTAGGEWITEPTPAPVPTKTPDEIRAEYQWIDARDLLIRPDSFEGQKLAVSGSVFNIQASGDYTYLQIYINGGNYDAVMIHYWGDSIGIYEGTWVTVYGIGDGVDSGTNAFGGTIYQPSILADIIDF